LFASTDNSEAQLPSASNDLEGETSLLQLSAPIDEMNSVDDDDSSAPLLMAMKRHSTVFAQHRVEHKSDDDSYTFGAAGDGSGKTFDITEDGRVQFPTPPTAEDEFLKSVETPGAEGKVRIDPSLNGTERDDSNVICVCKRQGAPRGFDRIRCKRNPTPTPTPVPVPPTPAGIKQCADGTWISGSDRGTADTICIYFPATEVKVTPPTPPEEEKPYPAECYDERNEYVAEGVREKAREKIIDIQILIQSGYENCGC